MQTIFAQATARGKAGVAVIRISGPDAFQIGRSLVGDLPEPGLFRYRAIRTLGGDILDRGLVLTFQGPRSFTGEDVVELQVHGSIAVVQAIENTIQETGLVRLADAGEFTRRALVNGMLDLTQVEALGDLIAAETEVQRQHAQAAMDGSLQSLANALRDDLLSALSLIELTIDFADEDVPVDVAPDVFTRLRSVEARLRSEVEGSFVAERLRGGFEVAIVGLPNSGKSTLLNRIAQRDVALTSDIPGTTRDVIEVRLDLAGMPVTFLDTAGLRSSEDEIEMAGVSRALDRAAAADVRVFLRLSPTDAFAIEEKADDISLQAKADLYPATNGVSGMTGEGVEDLLARVQQVLQTRLSEAGYASRERHRRSLTSALHSVQQAIEAMDAGDFEPEILSVSVRDAIGALESLVGTVDVEAVLGQIFSQFCIGK
ncbi:MAG: tRNA uridine-5-carboxymethylaminomethyl(34) synthesis GTPase MnmE [Pseudomonadota bacterium]